MASAAWQREWGGETTSFLGEIFDTAGLCGIVEASRSGRCYEFKGRHNGKPATAVAVVTCEGTDWQVSRSLLEGSGF